MSEHLQIFSEGTAAQPEQRQPDLPLLTEAERHQILVEWNNTAAEYPHDKCVHHVFEEQVERTPDAVAVVFEDYQLTYSELNSRANQLAWYLRTLGVGPEVLVGICVERSPDMVVGLLGILKAGGAYVPLDPAYPEERITFMLEDAQVSVLLTQQNLVNKFPSHGVHVFCLNTDWERVMSSERAENLVYEKTANNLAYVMYTSGSTGVPKGVMIPHQALSNHMFWMKITFYFTAADRILQKTPFIFDASVWEFYAPLLSGGTLILAKPGEHQDPVHLIDLIMSHGVTVFQGVPSLLSILSNDEHFHQCKSLRYIFSGGDALSYDLQRRLLKNMNANLFNLYGPTEACIDATYYPCEPNRRRTVVPIAPPRIHPQHDLVDKILAEIGYSTSAFARDSVAIGRPIANIQVYILDTQLYPVPVGVPGEIHLSGVGLARGYVNKPTLTAEKFIPNPLSDKPGERFYKTGDLARYRLDGNIEFLGRIDDQVKIRGFRVELGEIEAELSQALSVREAIVLAREDLSGNKQLVAYVVPPQELVPTPGELRGFLKKRLPEYMIPSIFVMLDALPLTSSGKVDRRALPVPGQARPGPEEAFVAPRTPVEEILAGIWAEVLGIERVGIHDDFFELGGHSLKATQVMSRIRQQYQVELPLHVFLEKPTIKESAAAVEQAKGSSAEHQRPTISRIPREAYRKRLTSQP